MLKVLKHGIMRGIFRRRREKYHAKARAYAFFPLKRKGTGKMLRDKGRVKNKIKNKNKIKTLGAIPQTPFFF